MAQACLKCLKLTMCVANFLCFLSGIGVLALGSYMTMSKVAIIAPTLASLQLAHILIITGIIITCVSFLGFLGALRENRCLLLTFFLILFILMLAELTAACLLLLYENPISKWLENELTDSLNEAKNNMGNSTVPTIWDSIQVKLECCGVNNQSDWGENVPKSCCIGPCDSQRANYYKKGCFEKAKVLFEDYFLTSGITVIIFCIAEVLGMCFAMTLFCHISRNGLGYKL